MSTRIPPVPVAAPKLPELNEKTSRKLAIQWEILCNRFGFTGDHLTWPQTQKIKVISTAPPPIGRGWYSQLKRQAKRQALTGSPYAPPEFVGVSESITLAKEYFPIAAGEYFGLWLVTPDSRHEEFTVWLGQLRASVELDVARLWSARGDWFDNHCRHAIGQALTPLMSDWTESAREAELRRLADFNSVEAVLARGAAALALAKTLQAEVEKREITPAPQLSQPPEHAARKAWVASYCEEKQIKRKVFIRENLRVVGKDTFYRRWKNPAAVNDKSRRLIEQKIDQLKQQTQTNSD